MPPISSGVVKGRRCPICGTENHACGLPYGGAPADIQEAAVPTNRDLYIYTDSAGNTFQMTEADGREAGYTRAGSQQVAAAERAREEAGGAAASAPDEPSTAEPDPDAKARGQAANKARASAEDK